MWAKVLLFYVLASLAVDSSLLRLDEDKDRSAIFNILSAFTIVEFLACAYFIYSVIESKIFKVVILVTGLGFLLFAVLYYFFGKHRSFDSSAASVEAILLVVYSILYMFDQLNKPQVMFIYQDPSFWFVIALMVYTSATLFLFIEADHLPKAMRRSVWKIAVFANIIKNILFSIAFAIKKPTNLDVSLQHTYEENSYENPYT